MDFGAILRFIVSVRSMLGFGMMRVLEIVQSGFDMARHGEGYLFIVVVPFQGDATE